MAHAGATRFLGPTPLYAALRDQFPDLDWFDQPTVVENYMVGGLVPTQHVGGARAHLAHHLAHHLDALVAPAERDGWGEYCATNLTKIDEALALAERLGFGFCEATEIYSGSEGNLN